MKQSHTKISHKKGSALLVIVLVLSLICSILAVGAAKITQASMNSTGSNKISIQAQQYATSEAELIRNMKYGDLSKKNKQAIPNTDFKKEVTLSGESDYSSSIKKRDVNIRIYYKDEILPRSNLTLTRYNVLEEAGGCQIVTGTNNVSFTSNGTYKSITVLSSATFSPIDGSWSGHATYNIAVNGSSLGQFSCQTSTQKAGSKGHYWGTRHEVTNQKTVNTNIQKGNYITVNLTGSSHFSTSTVTVILGS